MRKLTYTLFAAMVALTISATASAQSPYNDKSPEWWDNLEQQLVSSLDVPVSQVKQETLQHIVFFSTVHKKKIDLTGATPALLDIYENDPDIGRRTMALMALHAIGNAQTMQRLAELVKSEQSERIHSLTMAVLNEYYGS